MCQRLLGQVDAAEHSRDFLDAAVLIQFCDGSAGFIRPASLVHEQVVMSLGGDLRQVGDGQHLAALAEAAQQLANDLRGGAADTHVDFIEHQCRYAGCLRGDHLNRQADA